MDTNNMVDLNVPRNENLVVNCSKHTLHFSNGVMQFSVSDDLNVEESSLELTSNNSPSAIMRSIDWLGEKLAWFLGISSPKYYYIIEESKRNSYSHDSVMLGDLDDPHVSILNCQTVKTETDS